MAAAGVCHQPDGAAADRMKGMKVEGFVDVISEWLSVYCQCILTQQELAFLRSSAYRESNHQSTTGPTTTSTAGVMGSTVLAHNAGQQQPAIFHDCPVTKRTRVMHVIFDVGAVHRVLRHLERGSLLVPKKTSPQLHAGGMSRDCSGAAISSCCSSSNGTGRTGSTSLTSTQLDRIADAVRQRSTAHRRHQQSADSEQGNSLPLAARRQCAKMSSMLVGIVNRCGLDSVLANALVATAENEVDLERSLITSMEIATSMGCCGVASGSPESGPTSLAVCRVWALMLSCWVCIGSLLHSRDFIQVSWLKDCAASNEFADVDGLYDSKNSMDRKLLDMIKVLAGTAPWFPGLELFPHTSISSCDKPSLSTSCQPEKWPLDEGTAQTRTHLERLKDENLYLAIELSGREAELEQLRTELQRLERDTATQGGEGRRSDSSSTSQASAELETQRELAEQEKTIAKLQVTNGTLTAKLDSVTLMMNKAMGEGSEECRSLNDKLDLLKRKEEYIRDLEARVSRTQQLVAEAAIAKEEGVSLEERIEDLISENDRLNRKCFQLEPKAARLREMERELAETKGRLEEQMNKAQAADCSAHAGAQMVNVLQRNNMEYREIVHQLQGAIDLPSSDSSMSAHDINGPADTSALGEENEKLKAELAETKRRLAGLNSTNDELEGLRASNRKLLLSFNNARQMLQAAAEEKARLTSELAATASRCEHLKAEADTKQMEHTRQHCRSTKALQQSQQVYSSLEERFDERSANLEAAERNAAQLRTEHEQALNEAEALKSSCDNFKRQLDIEGREVLRLRSDIDTHWKTRVMSLERELNEMVEQRTELGASQRMSTFPTQEMDVSEPIGDQNGTNFTRDPQINSHPSTGLAMKNGQNRSIRGNASTGSSECHRDNGMEGFRTHNDSVMGMCRTPKLQSQRRLPGDEDRQDRATGYYSRAELSQGVSRPSGCILKTAGSGSATGTRPCSREGPSVKSSSTPRQSKVNAPAGSTTLAAPACKTSTVQASISIGLVSKKVPQRAYGARKPPGVSASRAQCVAADSIGSGQL
eukprot:GHVS01108073.1.p1 GENE.GHVS01108073.1~~GHVS01108073.1.p1  ORF type:complete len:1050 (+),score=123.93 GHVS01108073.1:250-3399(+)